MNNENRINNENQRGQLLEYNYAQIIVSTGLCLDVFTSSYKMPEHLLEYVEIPSFNGDYEGKYYNRNDGLWYEDSEFTVLAEGLN